MSAGEAGRDVVGFLGFVIDIFLQVQDKTYIQILYLIDYIAYGLQLWYKEYFSRKFAENLFPYILA